jgi:hypothetical protein
MSDMEFLVPSVGTSGRTNGKAPLCLEESVTRKGSDGVMEACVDWKPMHIFWL